MPQVGRTRQLSTPTERGSYSFNGITSEYTWVETKKKTVDNVGYPHLQNPFDSETWTVKEIPIGDYSRPYLGSTQIWKNCPPTCVSTGSITSFGTEILAMTTSQKYRRSYLEAVASTHPGEPAISLPNFIYELKDFPAVFKRRATDVRNATRWFKTPPHLLKNPPKTWHQLYEGAGRGSRDWLEYQFAIRPLINDIKSMFQVGVWMERRARFLARIRAEGFISRQATLGVLEYETANGRYPFSSAGQSWWGQSYVSCTQRSWVSARWRHTGQLPLGSFLQSEHDSLFLAALGLNVSFDTFWDAMPWSWLVDYFTDLSSILTVHNNRAGFVFDGAVQMTETRCRRTASAFDQTVWQGNAVGEYTRKQRTPRSVSLAAAGMNVLNLQQLGNLGALFVSRVT